MNAIKTAKALIEMKFSSAQYEELQDRRRERLNLWLDRGIKVIAVKEMELISQGEEVVRLLKEAGL